MKRALALTVLAAFAACKKQPPPEPQQSILQQAVKKLPFTPPCSSVIPENFSAGWPIPALDKGQVVYKLFFFGWEGHPKKEGIKLHSPEGEAAFTLKGEILACTLDQTPPKVFPSKAPAFASGEEREAFEREQYARTQKLADLWAAGRAPAPEDTAAFSEGFVKSEQAEHAAAYRALSPDFWAWLEKNGGKGP